PLVGKSTSSKLPAPSKNGSATDVDGNSSHSSLPTSSSLSRRLLIRQLPIRKSKSWAVAAGAVVIGPHLLVSASVSRLWFPTTGFMKRSTSVELYEARWIQLDRRPPETLRAGVERTLREAIQSGALRPGVRLPSSRALAAHLGVSRGVTTEAYLQLAAQGFLVTRTKSAPVVAEIPVRARTAAPAAPSLRPVRYDFTPNTPDVTLFPVRRWSSALQDAARTVPLGTYDYGDPRDEPELRRVLADQLGRTRGVVCEPAQIVVVQGAAQGIDLLARVLALRGA